MSGRLELLVAHVIWDTVLNWHVPYTLYVLGIISPATHDEGSYYNIVG